MHHSRHCQPYNDRVGWPFQRVGSKSRSVKEEVKLNVRLVIQDLISAQNQFKRPEPAHELHYLNTMSRGVPTGDSKPCYRDCLIFLLRGEFIIKGQERVVDTVSRQGRGLDLAMWDDDHSSYGGRGTERRMPEMHARITGTYTGREGWNERGEKEG